MSAYLQRLLDTGGLSVGLMPVPQSGSPVAEADQRLLSVTEPDFATPPAETGSRGFVGPGEPDRETTRPAILPPDTKMQPAPSRPASATPETEAPPALPVGQTATDAEIRDDAPPVQAERGPARTVPGEIVRTKRASVLPAPEPAPAGVAAEPAQDKPPALATSESPLPPTSDPDSVAPQMPTFAEPPLGQPPAPDVSHTETGPPATHPDVSEPVNPNPEKPVATTPVEPSPPDVPLPAPPPAPEVVERRVEHGVERNVVQTEAPEDTTREPPQAVQSAPRTAASLSAIGPLPDRQRLRRIHGLRWR